jgi:excisionase family DNA binding protein
MSLSGPTREQAAAREALLAKSEAGTALADESYVPLRLVAKMLGLSRQHVGDMIAEGAIVGLGVGLGARRRWLIRRDDVRRYLERRPSAKGT